MKVLFIILIFFFENISFIQERHSNQFFSNQINSLSSTNKNIKETKSELDSDEGLYITSKGVIKALAIFIQFKGDTSFRQSEFWKPDLPPVFLNSYLDSSLDQNSTPWSFSDYFRKMSFDSLRIYGKGYFAITPQTEKYYRDSIGLSNPENAYGNATKDVLSNLNSKINYADYDNWTFGLNHHKKIPDGKVDLIIILYRNSIYPLGTSAQGIALLGSTTDTTFDGKTIGFGFNNGSGITNSGGYQGMQLVLRSMKHEFGHRLLGAGHPTIFGSFGANNDATVYTGMWGIMPRFGYCANAFEREKLGWINPIIVTKNIAKKLSDFVTTGMVLKIPISGTNDFYYLENHKQLSIYDSELDQINGKGLFIYKVIGTANHPQYDVEVAEGKFDWSNYWVRIIGLGNDSIPVYTKLKSNRNGYDLRDWIPHNKSFSGGRFPIFVLDDDGPGVQTYKIFSGFRGDGHTAFNINYNNIFAPWTNPGSGNNNNISVAILSDSNNFMQVKVDVEDISLTKNTIFPTETFNFSGNLIVPKGITLTIPKEAVLKFAPGKSLIVKGKLQ